MELKLHQFHLQQLAAMWVVGGREDEDDERSTPGGQIAASDFHYTDSSNGSHDGQKHEPYIGYFRSDDENIP